MAWHWILAIFCFVWLFVGIQISMVLGVFFGSILSTDSKNRFTCTDRAAIGGFIGIGIGGVLWVLGVIVGVFQVLWIVQNWGAA